MTGLIATLTTEPEKVERAITLTRIIESGTPISVLARQADKVTVKRLLDVQLTKLVMSFNMNLNLKDYQITQLVEDLYSEFPNETIEDFIYVFRQARLGAYGEVYRLDSAVVFGWMKKHLEMKYEEIERRLMNEKDKPYEVISKDAISIEEAKKKGYIDQMLKNIGGIDSRPIRPLDDKEVKREGQEKPKKIGYRPNPEYAILRALETEYYRYAYHPLTREKYPDALSFEEWKMTNHVRVVDGRIEVYQSL